ncbi:hypothetical protein QBC47DRAFT_55163 [Echria macrotheca]|uniref:Uncharacterized protein n=1 Tax=Echria macrotheca TaxID=438768 RepID=A0AAJ0BAA2_9PEZI|nr:hypothetical protein QBC47DRAFT_55163 [Echria macrotheca]
MMFTGYVVQLLATLPGLASGVWNAGDAGRNGQQVFGLTSDNSNSRPICPPPLPPFQAQCPCSSPCADGCYHRPCCPKFKPDTYAAVRRIVGCETIQVDIPLCPVGECERTCMCREELFEELRDLLFRSNDSYRIDESVNSCGCPTKK